MMDTVTVSETLDTNSILSLPITRENFIAFSHRKRLQSLQDLFLLATIVSGCSSDNVLTRPLALHAETQGYKRFVKFMCVDVGFSPRIPGFSPVCGLGWNGPEASFL
jgi:hypothetical protein